MTTLDDYLEPLHHGVWEVKVPKELVTEPLDPGWEPSLYPLPKPGSIASYRKGFYHLHETLHEWRVHLDRYDPNFHPFVHAIDDGPLVFLITDLFVTLITDSEQISPHDTQALLKEQKTVSQLMMTVGVVIILAGVLMSTYPLSASGEHFTALLPLALMAASLLIVPKGIHRHPLRISSGGRMVLSLGLFALGAVPLFISPIWTGAVFTLFLALWAISSTILSIKAIPRGQTPSLDNYYRRLTIGIVSLVLSAFLFLAPPGAVTTSTYIVAALAGFLGASQVMTGYRLSSRMRKFYPRREW
ncbi:MAG TPA: DUF308 domain-containing protein [Methanomicrobiales archaeon]|nr:DUF308 domain-containing protein [Methanomicrobiales archaeon]